MEAPLTPSRRRLLVGAWAVVSLVLLLRLGWRMVELRLAPVQPIATPIRIDINRARVAELMVLDGVGRVRAEQIVLHRVRYGPFRRMEDLLDVDGIGPETLARLRPLLRDVGQ